MHYFETNPFNKLFFRFYTRYVDDPFISLNSGHFDLPNILMNSINEDKQFTFEFEIEIKNRPPFLHVMIFHEINAFYAIVYCKLFAVSLTHHLSYHPLNQKLGAFNTYVRRDLNIYSSKRLM